MDLTCMYGKVDLRIYYYQIKMKEMDARTNNFKTRCCLVLLFHIVS